MTTPELIQLAGAVLGPLGGTYFGFRAALNGMRGTLSGIGADVREVRDIARESKLAIEQLGVDLARVEQEVKED